MRILIVEDDYLHEEAIAAAIRTEFPESEIETICTELQLRQSIERIALSPPDLIILDVMIRWTDPGPELARTPVPADAKEGGYYRAGLRCKELLRGQNANVPIVLYSILEARDLQDDLGVITPEVFFLSKGSDPEPLLKLIRNILGGE